MERRPNNSSSTTLLKPEFVPDFPSYSPYFEGFSSKERTIILIDGSNMHAALKSLGYTADYQIFLWCMSTLTDVRRALYFTAVPEGAPKSAPIVKQTTWLDNHGYTVIRKPTKEYTTTDASGTEVQRIKGNMDVEFTIHAMLQAQAADHIVLCTGDGDFVSLVRHLQLNMQKKVTVISTRAGNRPVLSEDLKKAADYVVDLVDVREIIDRPPAGVNPWPPEDC